MRGALATLGSGEQPSQDQIERRGHLPAEIGKTIARDQAESLPRVTASGDTVPGPQRQPAYGSVIAPYPGGKKETGDLCFQWKTFE